LQHEPIAGLAQLNDMFEIQTGRLMVSNINNRLKTVTDPTETFCFHALNRTLSPLGTRMIHYFVDKTGSRLSGKVIFSKVCYPHDLKIFYTLQTNEFIKE